MNQAQGFSELYNVVYAYLSTEEENKSGYDYEKIQKITKGKKHFVMPSPSNKNQARIMPIITINQLCGPQYEITNSIDDRVENFIAKSISRIPEVEYILLSKKDNYYEIWTVINKLDREARDRIYDIEYDILERFRDNYFDFHVICRDDKSIGKIFPTNAIIYYRRIA